MGESHWIHGWLDSEISLTPDGSYRHRTLTEQSDQRDQAVRRLSEALRDAHEDVRRHLRELARDPLNPIPAVEAYDPVEGYPEALHINTLKGYFGEVMAGLVAENFDVVGFDDWEVPLYLFRFDSHILVHLERIQKGAEPTPQPGRSGHDCLAFRRDESGLVAGCLVCEAKCTADHKISMVTDGCGQLSGDGPNALDLINLIDRLSDYNDGRSQSWRLSLRWLLNGRVADGYERHDFLMYVYGREPKNKSKWIGDEPPSSYVAGRKLEAAELFLDELETLVISGYKDDA